MTDRGEVSFDPPVWASGMYCPVDGGDLEVAALLFDQPGNPGVRIPRLRLLCAECDWQGPSGEAVQYKGSGP